MEQQVLYLIIEAVNPGKGADCVINLVHHFIDQYGHGEKYMYLQADNCVGQIKNNANVHYLLWRVLTGCEVNVELLKGYRLEPTLTFFTKHRDQSLRQKTLTIDKRTQGLRSHVPELT